MREPSVVAVDVRSDSVKFVGQEAKDVIGRTPGSIVAVRPLKDGVIADFDITTSMLQLFIKKGAGQLDFCASPRCHLHSVRCNRSRTPGRKGSDPESRRQICVHH